MPKPQPKNLTPGAKCNPSDKEVKHRIAVLTATIAKHLPQHIHAVAHCARDSAQLMLHQDAFAAGYDDDEYMLLGMAIKYAGLFGVEVCITGHNGTTFKAKGDSV